MNEQEFNGTFLIRLSGMLLTFIGTVMMYCLKSKCKKCNVCCGFITIDRDIESELIEEKELLDRGINPFAENKNINS